MCVCVCVCVCVCECGVSRTVVSPRSDTGLCTLAFVASEFTWTLRLRKKSAQFKIRFYIILYSRLTLNFTYILVRLLCFMPKLEFLKFLFPFGCARSSLLCMSFLSFSCGESGLLFVAGHRLLTAVPSLSAKCRLLSAWASVVGGKQLISCGSRTLEHWLSSWGASI